MNRFLVALFALGLFTVPVRTQQSDRPQDLAKNAQLKQQIQQDRLRLETDKAALLTATKELQSAIDRHGRNSAEAKAAEEKFLDLKKRVEADRAKLHADERQRTALATDASKDLYESAKKPKPPKGKNPTHR